MNSLLRLLGLERGTAVDSIARVVWEFAEPLSRGLLYALIAAGLALAALNFIPSVKMRLRTRLWTFFLRLGMVALLLILIQKGEMHLRLKLQQKQNWQVLVDDSASMATRDAGTGKTSRFAAVLEDVAKIRAATDGKVNLKVDTLSGAELGGEPGKGPTLIQKGVGRVALGTSGLDRLMFLTDGRDTEGRDFTDFGNDIKARGIALAVKLYGSSIPPEDSAIFAEPERTVIRLGEDLVIRGSVTGSRGRKAEAGTRNTEPAAPAGAGAPVSVTLKEDGKTVKQLSVPQAQLRRFLVTYKPPKAGRHQYALELAGNDSVSLNNAYSFKATVVQEKISVLMIEGFPRYEFKLMKYAIETDPMVHLVTICHIPGGGVYVQGIPLHKNPEEGLISSQAELFKYDVVILRDVSRLYFRAGGDVSESRLRNIVEFVTKRGGGLVVTGGQDVYRAGGYEDSALMEVLPFDLTATFSKEPQFEGEFFVAIPKTAYSHPVLRMFSDPEKNKERLGSLRQLDGCNNVGRFKPLATPLLTRFVKIKDSKGERVEHEVPVMAYQAVGEGKVVATSADTLWRWELQPDFDDPPLQTLLANIVRYVAPPPHTRAGSPYVTLADNSPQVGQEVVLSTTLKDKNYDPIRNAALKITVTRPDGSRQHLYPRDLPEQPGYYEFKVPVTVPGAYEVKAEYEKQVYETSFVAEASGSEFANLSSDAGAMQTLTKAAGGTLVDSMDSWLHDADTRPSTREEVRDLQVWNSPMMLLVFFLLVCADCYVRKRQGLV